MSDRTHGPDPYNARDTRSLDLTSGLVEGYDMAGDTPAGWYGDPMGRYEHRYWNGSVWTENVRDERSTGRRPDRIRSHGGGCGCERRRRGLVAHR